MSVVSLLAGLLSYSVVISQLALSTILLMLAALALCHVNISRVRYAHSLPDTVYERQEFEIGMLAENEKQVLHAFDIEIADAALRSHRHTPSAITGIPPDRTVEQAEMTYLATRGIYNGSTFKLSSSFPFGLFAIERTGVLHDRVVVCPAPVLPPDVLALIEAGMGQGETKVGAAAEQTGQFRATREHRPGDRPNTISWPLTARFQKLVVRETEHPAPKRVVVVFHSYCPRGSILTGRSFENALQLLCGLFLHFQRNMIAFDFIASFHSWKPIPVPVEGVGLESALTALATARMHPSHDVVELTQCVANIAESPASLLIVSNTPVGRWVPMLPRVSSPCVCMDNLRVTTS